MFYVLSRSKINKWNIFLNCALTGLSFVLNSRKQKHVCLSHPLTHIEQTSGSFFQSFTDEDSLRNKCVFKCVVYKFSNLFFCSFFFFFSWNSKQLGESLRMDEVRIKLNGNKFCVKHLLKDTHTHTLFLHQKLIYFHMFTDSNYRQRTFCASQC